MNLTFIENNATHQLVKLNISFEAPPVEPHSRKGTRSAVIMNVPIKSHADSTILVDFTRLIQDSLGRIRLDCNLKSSFSFEIGVSQCSLEKISV